MIEIDFDRRQSPRVALRRPCKVFNPRSGRYVSGSTCDVSTGGMLIRLERPLNVEIGDRLYLGVAQKRRQALLRSTEMIEAEVVRSLTGATGEMLLGIRLTRPGQKILLPFRQAA
ncbi:MAG: PilZ domain-containing protein [Planctomycetota bacterium]|nr:PilZ domain-containing protein [Planctomycetota bacterium]